MMLSPTLRSNAGQNMILCRQTLLLPPSPLSCPFLRMRQAVSYTVSSSILNAISCSVKPLISYPVSSSLSKAVSSSISTAISDAGSPTYYPFQGPPLVSMYLLALAKYPIITKCVTAAIIFFLADTTSQGIKIALSGEDGVHWDVRRMCRMVAAGLLLSGTTLHLWFTLISKTLPFQDLVSILKKTALGQIVYGPVFNTLFFSFNAYLQGETTHEVVLRLRRDLMPTLKNGFVYWTVCDFLTFRYVPVHLQPLANNSFAYMWTIYLTYAASSKKMEN